MLNGVPDKSNSLVCFLTTKFKMFCVNSVCVPSCASSTITKSQSTANKSLFLSETLPPTISEPPKSWILAKYTYLQVL